MMENNQKFVLCKARLLYDIQIVVSINRILLGYRYDCLFTYFITAFTPQNRVVVTESTGFIKPKI